MMETVRVDIVYRPLRIGFALLSTDLDNYRKAIRLCHAFWGGRYNPLIPVDRPEADQLVELFRPDFLVPLGELADVATFVGKYNYLPRSYHLRELFSDGRARLLDVRNQFIHWRERGEWKDLVNRGFRIAKWENTDPLADAFLAQFGGYPEPAEVGFDYAQLATQASNAIELPIEPAADVPVELLDHPGISYLSRFGLKPHYSSDASRIFPGIFVGDASRGEDLIHFWNLRACGIRLLFLDPAHAGRMLAIRAAYEERLRASLSTQDRFHRQPAVWSRKEISEKAREAAGNGFMVCAVTDQVWNGLNIRPFAMHLGEESSLGVLGGSEASPRISFALKDKPFSGSVEFFQQRLVASLSLIGGGGDGADYIFVPPYLPELNEFAGRVMYYDFPSIRLERERIGIVIGAADHDLSLKALPVSSLIEQAFGMGGFVAKPSASGLITRQLIARMGGLDGARAFKIPGVRRLLKTHGPNTSFTRKGAIQLIASPDPVTRASFADHKRLFIEPREFNTDLTPQMVFSHLVEKGLFRIGADLKCPVCSLTSWSALDALHQQSVCPFCGSRFDPTRQLVEGEYSYRRSGVLGLEKNTQGAVPVVLLLQQLFVNLGPFRHGHAYGASFDLVPTNPGSGLPTCETDFVLLTLTPRSYKTTVLIGECKDAGGTIDADDVDNLRQVAEAFPKHRFDVFILLAKLAPFTAQEIALARTLNTKSWQRRMILLTARELEPYSLFERTNAELGLNLRAVAVDDLAEATHQIYFAPPAPRNN